VEVKARNKKKRSLINKINNALTNANTIRTIKFVLVGFVFVTTAVIIMSVYTSPGIVR